ncbi:hypothetical protein [Marinimicrobium sp. ARAG 43.8]|uniref:hypothetical protein n=1 Tax=Marinimicrobium sp. ARAG 43.8 TaxID=3418719 RepID=UPI003CE815B9
MRLGACLAVLFLCGCASVEPLPKWITPPSDQDREALLSGEQVPGVGENDRPARYDLMALSPPMRTLAQELMRQHRRPDERAEALHRALLAAPLYGGQGMRYTALNTSTAQDAFRTRSVNCLSFTLIYVAMAREMGLDVRVNDVRVPPTWEWREGEPFVLFRHVNAKVMLRGGEQLVVDLEMQRYSPAYSQELIGDRLVAAQFYNNRGMELVAEGELADGFLHLRQALALDDQQSYIWNNLGTLYNRLEEGRLAELAYLQGLSLDLTDLTLMSNLDSLYRQRGDREKAAYFSQRRRLTAITTRTICMPWRSNIWSRMTWHWRSTI